MKDLVELIKQNPGARFIVDNDSWSMHKPFPDGFDGWDEEAQDHWTDASQLVGDDEVTARGDGGYGSGNCYGGDILQALAEIVGVEIESV
jgi:hypothetical protein